MAPHISKPQIFMAAKSFEKTEGFMFDAVCPMIDVVLSRPSPTAIVTLREFRWTFAEVLLDFELAQYF